MACNPMELVKVRLQSKGALDRGVISVLREVTANGGIRGLWKGTVPSAVRPNYTSYPSKMYSHGDRHACEKTLRITDYTPPVCGLTADC